MRQSKLNRSASSAFRPTVNVLEDREVPAGLSLDPTTHVLTITGDAGNDYGQVRYATTQTIVSGGAQQAADTSMIEATVTTSTGYTTSQTFAKSSISSVVFNGKGGNDVFINSTSLSATKTTTATGVVSGSVTPGSPSNTNTNDQVDLGVFTTSSTGVVSVNYLYCGAGYHGQLGLYNLDGMEAYTPGSSAYIQEAARRALSNSTQGAAVIDRSVEGAQFSGSTPWEGNLNGGPYLGAKSFNLAANAHYGAILVPNGHLRDIYNNPTATGSLRPLFSVPSANPYVPTPQMLGQMGDLTGSGSTFAFEDLRLDSGSDRDYNDLVFQVTGARAVATPVSEVANSSRVFTTTTIGQSLVQSALAVQATDTSMTGGFQSGTFTVGANGKVGIDFLFDGGGYIGQVGVFSLQGMAQYTPGSADFIQEAARRVLSSSTLGNLVINDITDGASYATSSEQLLKSFNSGTYNGIKTVNMTPGDTVGFMLIPNGTAWQVFSNPTIEGNKRPMFSMPEANPTSSYGSNQFAQADSSGKVFGFEDVRLDATGTVTCDRDYNDIVFRTYGLTVNAATSSVGSIAVTGRDWTKTTLGNTISNNSEQFWSF